ncbi:MAG: glycosyltransferase [Candidatus Zixiibacteriota bacterium]
MNILLYSHVRPFPILTGRELRIYHVWKLMARRHRVHLIYQTPDEPDRETREHLDSLFASTTHFMYKPIKSVPNGLSVFKIIRDIFHPPIEDYSMSAYDDDVRVAIETTVREQQIEAVYTYGLNARQYVSNLTKVAMINDIGDDPTVLHFRLMKEKKGLVNKLRAIKDWLTARNFEKKELSKIAHIAMISFDDARIHRRLCPNSDITILPNGVDSDFFKTRGRPENGKPVLIFSGVMNYEPNITAALYFCREIYPRIKKEIPDVSLYIVGRYPTDKIKTLDSEKMGITVTGEVADIKEYFDRSQVYVCPLRSGAGIKNKILESWAMSIPVVATSLSCEGIEVSPGEDILVADSAEDFARKTMELLKNPELGKKLARNGRKKVEDKYSWDSRCDIIENKLKELMGSRQL